MTLIEKHISPLIQEQFPQFYKEQGSLFILFVEEYFKWLEGNSYATYKDSLITGNALYHIRRLFEYRDIDRTVDEFLIFFKEKYLKNVQAETNISKKRLVKAAHDLFSSKGSERSLDLFFKLLYGTKIEIYYPGQDILKASDGTWVLPVYLELSRTSRSLSFPGKQITGGTTGATAFVEYIITRNINGKLVDIAFLSNVRGRFISGEIITDGGSVQDAPVVLGSLTGLNITVAGELFQVGEVVNVISSRGIEGSALVTSIESVTGVVRFTLLDGGWGYSNTTAEAIVSEKVVRITNIQNSNTDIISFNRFETVSQNLYSFVLTNVSGIVLPGTIYRNNDNNFSISAVASVTQNIDVSANQATIILNQISGNVFSNSIIYDANKSIVVTNTNVVFNIGDFVVQSNGSSNNVTGFISSSSNVYVITVNTSTIGANGLHVGTYVIQDNTGATGVISTIPRENLFTYTNVSHISISSANGTFNNTDTISIYSDSSNTTEISQFTPIKSEEGYQYLLVQTNTDTDVRWSTSNTIIKQIAPVVNTNIIIASDIGGVIVSSNDVTATANLLASNSTALGLIDITGSFYATGNTTIVGSVSNTVANTIQIYTGLNANLSIGIIENPETVRVALDFLNSNNDGPGISSVKFVDMLITGANSTYGYLTSVSIFDSGTGYDNTDIIVFEGGNTGAGSFEIANASLITDTSGNIISVILSSNTGNNITSNPNVSIVTSTGSDANLVPTFPLGFTKLILGDINSPINDLLRYSTKTIGSISTIVGVNPGENYNINPFVNFIEPEIMAYGKQDIILEVGSLVGPIFTPGEFLEQTVNTAALQITSNAYSGNTGLFYEVGELVYSTDGISNVATGVVYSHTRDVVTNVHTTILTSNTGVWQNTIPATILDVSSNTNFNAGDIVEQGAANGTIVTSNSTTLIIKNVQGTFTVNSTPITSNSGGNTTINTSTNNFIYTIKGLTTKGTSSITNTSPYTASTLARGIVKALQDNSKISVKRISLFTEFRSGSTVVGKSTGSVANIVSVGVDYSSNVIGDNAVLLANVVASEGSISSVQVLNSGLGYVDKELVQLISQDGKRVALAQANVYNQGIGAGYYSSTNGFTNNNKYIIDGEYYQNYSYEIRSGIPIEKYFDMLKDVLHISGKKLFGRVVSKPEANLNITGTTVVIIT